MSEHHRKHGEAMQPLEHRERHDDQHERIREKIESEAAGAKHEHEELIDTIQEAAEKAAVSKAETIAHHTEQDAKHDSSPVFINKELKDLAYHRSLMRIRKKLSLSDKALSNVIHQPIIEKMSDLSGKTIARPSGLLGASFIGFLGGSLYFFATKHYGYEYSFFVFIALVIVGFGLGLIFEFLLSLLRKR